MFIQAAHLDRVELALELAGIFGGLKNFVGISTIFASGLKMPALLFNPIPEVNAPMPVS